MLAIRVVLELVVVQVDPVRWLWNPSRCYSCRQEMLRVAVQVFCVRALDVEGNKLVSRCYSYQQQQEL